jgi:hypothetical protein
LPRLHKNEARIDEVPPPPHVGFRRPWPSLELDVKTLSVVDFRKLLFLHAAAVLNDDAHDKNHDATV